MDTSSIKGLHKNVAEWLAGPTGSVIIHVALVLALLFLVDLTTKEPDQEIEVKVIEIDEQQLDELIEELEPPEELPDLVETMTPPDVNPDMTPPPDVQDFTASPMMDTVTELDIASDALSPIILKNLAPGNMANRSGSGRAAAIGAHGGQWGQYAEAAVLRALAWLKANQNPDGSWGTRDREGYTGLALLTFLAHGETTASAEYGQTVEKGIRYLVARQNEKGEFVKTENSGGVYGHAIASYAIAEAYGMTRIPSLKPVMEKCVQVIINGQQSHGGWIMYTFGKGDVGRWDVSLSGFCIQAVKAAYIAGAQNKGLKDTLDKAAAFLKARQREDGGFPYSASNPGRQPNMTAVSVLCLQLMGYGTDSEVKAGLRYIRDADASWSKPEQAPLYSWYYVSQARFHEGGASWSSWNNKFAPALIRNQNKDGSWLSPGLALTGDGVTREFRGDVMNNKVYATTFAALSLQVYYRFLPTYQPIEDKVYDQTSDNDIQIEIL
ncbi:MAG: terpene cyclase/mutase family protein [Lentisphaerae bacterium]|nr:terpene cyclase/mutase family protein [Lentisphaerota bacterium]